MKDGKNVHVSPLLLIPKGSRALSMRYASLALCTLSRLDLMSSRGISSMSEALWPLERKCSDQNLLAEYEDLSDTRIYLTDNR